MTICVFDGINNDFADLDYSNILKDPQTLYDEDGGQKFDKQISHLTDYLKTLAKKEKSILKNDVLGNKYFIDTKIPCYNKEGKNVYKIVNNIPNNEGGLIDGIINDITHIRPSYLIESVFNTTSNIQCKKIDNVKCYNENGHKTGNKTIYIDKKDKVSDDVSKEDFNNIFYNDNNIIYEYDNNDIIINIYFLSITIILFYIIFKLTISKR